MIQRNLLLDLPTEITHVISDHLTLPEINSLLRTCHLLHRRLKNRMAQELKNCRLTHGGRAYLLGQAVKLENLQLASFIYENFLIAPVCHITIKEPIVPPRRDHYYTYDQHKEALHTTTPLHLAAHLGNLEMMKLLISKFNEEDHLPEFLDFDDGTYSYPLLIAAERNHIEVCRVLLDHKANVHICDDENWKPIHHAARNKNLELVQLLISHGALEIHDMPNEDGYNALLYAAENGDSEIVKSLLNHGADPEQFEFPSTGTPLHFAANPNIARIILEYIRDGEADKIIYGLSREAVEEDAEHAPLHQHAQCHNVEMVKFWLGRSVPGDLLSGEQYGLTPLDYVAVGAVYMHKKKKVPAQDLDRAKELDTAFALLEAGADVGKAIQLMEESKGLPKVYRDRSLDRLREYKELWGHRGSN